MTAARRDAGQVVRYGAARTAWGRVWAALGAGGVVAVALGSAPVGKLAEEVERRHPGRLVHDPNALAGLLDDLVQYLKGRRQRLDWDPDYTGLSEFRRDLYQALRRVPYGRIVSFAELAGRVASPRHAHVAGQALLRNPFRLVVPDHRVVLAGEGGRGVRAARGWQARLLALEAGQTALDWGADGGRRP